MYTKEEEEDLPFNFYLHHQRSHDNHKYLRGAPDHMPKKEKNISAFSDSFDMYKVESLIDDD